MRTSTGGTPGDRVRRERRGPDRLQEMLRSLGLGDKFDFYPKGSGNPLKGFRMEMM